MQQSQPQQLAWPSVSVGRPTTAEVSNQNRPHRAGYAFLQQLGHRRKPNYASLGSEQEGSGTDSTPG